MGSYAENEQDAREYAELKRLHAAEEAEEKKRLHEEEMKEKNMSTVGKYDNMSDEAVIAYLREQGFKVEHPPMDADHVRDRLLEIQGDGPTQVIHNNTDFFQVIDAACAMISVGREAVKRLDRLRNEVKEIKQKTPESLSSYPDLLDLVERGCADEQ